MTHFTMGLALTAVVLTIAGITLLLHGERLREARCRSLGAERAIVRGFDVCRRSDGVVLGMPGDRADDQPSRRR